MASGSFRHLQLRLTALDSAAARYLVAVDEARAPVSGPFTIDRATFATDGGDLLTLLHERRIGDEQLVRLGTILAGLLLPDPIRRRFVDELRIGERLGGLRLLLNIEAPELRALPWEYLLVSQSAAAPDYLADFLALREKVSLARCAATTTTATFTPSPRYRLLAAAGQAQRDAIAAACAGGGPVRLSPAWLEHPAPDALDESLRDPPAIAHLGAAALDALAIEPARLAAALAGAQVRLAVLGLPEQGTPPRARHDLALALLRAGVAAVLVADESLMPADAGALAGKLYSSIAAGDLLDDAVSKSRVDLFNPSSLSGGGWGGFALYLGTGVAALFPPPGAASISVIQNIGSSSGTVIAVQERADAAAPAPAPRLVPRMRPAQREEVLFGRDATIGQVRERLDQGGKAFLCGAVGVGKTSLATELFRRLAADRPFADGTVWLDAGGLTAEQLLEQIAAPFGDRRVANEVGSDARVNALRALLGQRPDVLIGVDELHDPDVARTLLSATGDSPVILNGSARLDLGGMAHPFELAPLDPAASARLFAAEALLDEQTLSPTEQARVRELCERARHMPLAVRMLARRARSPQRAGLAPLLDRLIRQIERAPATLLGDQASDVERIIADSFARLQRQSPAAIRLLVRLAAFPAGEAPESAIFGGLSEQDTFSAPDRLRDYFLVDDLGAGRLALHPLLSTLVAAHAPARMRAQERRVAERWLLDYAAAHERDYAALAEEHRNLLGLLRALEDAGRWDDTAALMRRLVDYLRVRGLWALALEHLDLLAGAADQLTRASERGWVLLQRATAYLLQSRFGEAVQDFDRTDTAFAAAGDQVGQGVALARRSGILSMRGELTQAAEMLRRALELMSTTARDDDRAEAHARLAGILATQGNQAGAQEHYQQALGLASPEGRLRACIALGRLARQAGDDEAARARYEEALALAEQLGHALAQAQLEQELGHLAYFRGRFDEAQSHFHAAERAYERLEYRPGLAQIRHAYGSLALAAGDLDAAEQRYREALAINQALGVKTSIAYNRYMLGVVAQSRGDREAAMEHYAAAQQAAARAETQDVQLLAAALYQQAKLAAAQQRAGEAVGLLDRAVEQAERGRDARTWHAALQLRAELHEQQGRADQAEHDRQAADALAGSVAGGAPGARSEALAARVGDDPLAELRFPARNEAHSSDGIYIARVSGNIATIWTSRARRPLVELQGHTGEITCVAWSPHGARLATASADMTARIWQMSEATRSAGRRRLVQPRQLAALRHEGWVSSIAWSLDGLHVVTASWDTTARVWDAGSGRELLVLRGHGRPLEDAAWSPDGASIVTAGRDGTARLWDAATGRELHVLGASASALTRVAWSADGTRVFTAGEDGMAHAWDAGSGQLLAVAALDQRRTGDRRSLLPPDIVKEGKLYGVESQIVVEGGPLSGDVSGATISIGYRTTRTGARLVVADGPQRASKRIAASAPPDIVKEGAATEELDECEEE